MSDERSVWAWGALDRVSLGVLLFMLMSITMLTFVDVLNEHGADMAQSEVSYLGNSLLLLWGFAIFGIPATRWLARRFDPVGRLREVIA